MFDSLFGIELPLAAKFVLAFVVVLALIAGTFWLIRRFGASRAAGGQARGRQPRLAVIDATAVDSRRRLVLIRRDNVEHLVMIGGPSDVVIEQNIVRAVPVAPPRDAPFRDAPPKPAETVTRGSDLVRPEAAPSRPTLPPETTWSPPPLPDPIRPRSEQPPPRPSEPPRPLPESLASMRSTPLPPMPEPRPPRPPADLPPVEVRQSPPTADVNLADMAQRLEAALRRPGQAAAEARSDRPPPPREPPARPPPRPAPSDLPSQFTRTNPRPAPSTETPPRSALTMEPPPRPAPPPHIEPPPLPLPPMSLEPPPRPPAPAPAELLTIETHTIETHTIETHIPESHTEPPHAEAAHTEPPYMEPPHSEPPPAEAREHPAPEPDPVKPMSKSVFDSLEEEMASLLGRPDKP